MKHKRGDVREDGMVYYSRKKRKNGSWREIWFARDRFEVVMKEDEEWRAKNQDLLKLYSKRRERCPVKAKAYYDSRKQMDPDYGRIRYLRDRDRHGERRKEASAAYRAENINRVRAWRRNSYRRLKEAGVLSTPMQKLSRNCRRRVCEALRDKKGKTMRYIGCDWKALMAHLESLFQAGMSWDNYGKDGWHVDHRTPLASACSVEELVPLLHYTNLQPLWALDNLRKGSRIE